MAYFDNHFEVSGPVNAVKAFIGALGNNGVINTDRLNNLVGNKPGENDDFEWVQNYEYDDDADIECQLTIGETMAWAEWEICGGTSWDSEDVVKLSLAFKDLDIIHGFTRDASLTYFNHFKNGEVVNSREYGEALLMLSLVVIDTHTYLTGSENAERILKEIDKLDSILDFDEVIEWLSDEDAAYDDNLNLEANDFLLLNACLNRLDDDFYQGISEGILKKIHGIRTFAKALNDYEGELPANNPNAWLDEEGGE